VGWRWIIEVAAGRLEKAKIQVVSKSAREYKIFGFKEVVAEANRLGFRDGGLVVNMLYTKDNL